MDTRLRTSFVPKKTLALKGSSQSGNNVVNPLFSLALIFFCLTVAAAGGEYLYKVLLDKQVVGLKSDLSKAKDAFEAKTVEEWTRRDNRINVANELLSKHKVVSPIFSLLEETTMRTTRFLDFNFSEVAGVPVIKMKGEGLSYTSVALLSDSFNQEPKIKNPIFSDLTLSEKGGVQFSFTGSVDPSVTSYKEMFNQQ